MALLQAIYRIPSYYMNVCVCVLYSHQVGISGLILTNIPNFLKLNPYNDNSNGDDFTKTSMGGNSGVIAEELSCL